MARFHGASQAYNGGLAAQRAVIPDVAQQLSFGEDAVRIGGQGAQQRELLVVLAPWRPVAPCTESAAIRGFRDSLP
jgi:hypothetical protein